MKSRLILGFTTIAMCLILMTCGDDTPSAPETDPPEDPDVTSQEIGPDGGEITSNDGNLTLTFPEGALPSPETITITPLSEGELGEEFNEIVDSLGVANAYEMGPDGLEFDEMVVASMPSGQNAVQNDSTLQLSLNRLMLTSSDGQVEGLDSLFVAPGGDESGEVRLFGQLSHFSTFVATGTDASIFRATISGIPKKLQVEEEINLEFRVQTSAELPAGQETVIAAPFASENTSFVPTPATSGIEIPKTDQIIDVSIFERSYTYRCRSEGSNPVRVVIGTEIESVPDLIEFEQSVIGVSFNFETDILVEDIQDNDPVLTDPTQCVKAMPALTVLKDGMGDGTVTSDPEGIDFGDDNTEDFEAGTEVTLTASPDENSTFNGWSGDIGDADAQSETITVTMDQDRDITATFNEQGTNIMADVSIGITSSPVGGIPAGETGSVTVEAENQGPDDAPDTAIMLEMDKGQITGMEENDDINCDDDFPTTQVTCALTSPLVRAALIAVVFEIESQEPGTLTLTSTVTSDGEDPNPENNSDEVEIEVKEPPLAGADLAIGLDNVDTQIAPGETGTARLSVVNFGPDTPTEAGFVFRFADGVITRITDDPAITCTNPPSEEIGCNIVNEENFDTNSVIELNVEYSAETEGTRDLTAEISASSTDPDESNNSIAVEVDVQEPNDGATELQPGVYELGSIAQAAEALFSITNPTSSGTGSVRFGNSTTQSRVEETKFGDITGKLPVVFSGESGFIVKDLLTGEILTEQFASAGAPAFGVIGLTETPRGPDSPATFVLFGETGVGFYSANFSGGTQSGNQPTAFDAFPAGGNAESSYGVSAYGGSVRYIDIEEGDSRHLFRSLFDELAPSANDFDGQVVSAWMPDDGTPNDTPAIVLDRDTDPNNNTESGLYFLPRGDANNAPTPQRLADVGLDARKVRCQDLNDGNFLCAVTVFGEDTVELFIWDGGSTLNSAASVSVGNGPVDLQLRELPSGNFGLVTTGFNDNTYTVAELAPDGSVRSTNTVVTPSGCQRPAHAIFLRDAASLKVVGTCFESSNYFVGESGL